MFTFIFILLLLSSFSRQRKIKTAAFYRDDIMNVRSTMFKINQESRWISYPILPFYPEGLSRMEWAQAKSTVLDIQFEMCIQLHIVKHSKIHLKIRKGFKSLTHDIDFHDITPWSYSKQVHISSEKHWTKDWETNRWSRSFC